jgi:hypothetical protein
VLVGGGAGRFLRRPVMVAPLTTPRPLLHAVLNHYLDGGDREVEREREREGEGGKEERGREGVAVMCV